jgi:small conductance mechanosensitive channel
MGQIPTDVTQIQSIISQVSELLTGFMFKLIGAFILWMIGRKLISFSISLISKAVKAKHIDPTLITYLVNTVTVILQIILVVAILGFFGVETTSFAALLAAAGIAIGAAWGGLLSNFAAGAFLIIFRPFNEGDFITAAGITGTVKEVGLFVTSIDTLDNVRTIVGNNTIFSGTIQNFSTNRYRRVELVAQLNHEVDPKGAIAMLKERLSQIPNVHTDPIPEVDILEFNLAGPVLAVRPYCHNDDYWQVYFDTNAVIRESFGEANYPTPEQHLVLRNVS